MAISTTGWVYFYHMVKPSKQMKQKINFFILLVSALEFRDKLEKLPLLRVVWGIIPKNRERLAVILQVTHESSMFFATEAKTSE